MTLRQKYDIFQRRMRKLDLSDALATVHAYHGHIVDRRPLPWGVGVGMPPDYNLRSGAHPWELDVLAREVLLNAGTHPNPKARLASFEDFGRAINAIKKMSDIGVPSPGADALHRHLHRIGHQQFPWQTGRFNRRSAVRFLKVFGTPGVDALVRARHGMSVYDLFLLALLCQLRLRETAAFETAGSALPGVSTHVVQAFLQSITTTPGAARTAALSRQVYDDGWAFTWNPLRSHPLIRHNPKLPTSVVCPLPSFLLTRVTAGVYYDIVREPAFANAFGGAFETYVGEVIRAACPSPRFEVAGEETYHVGKNKKHGVDWRVTDGSATVFIECKTKRMTVGARDATDEAALEQDIGTLARAIVQHYENIADALDGRTGWTPDGLPSYMMVVTFESWYLMSHTVRRTLQDKVNLKMAEKGLGDMADRIPYQVVSIIEFEETIAVMGQVGIDAVNRGKLEEQTRDWEFGPFLQQAFPAERRLTRDTPLFPADEAGLLEPLRQIAGVPALP